MSRIIAGVIGVAMALSLSGCEVDQNTLRYHRKEVSDLINLTPSTTGESKLDLSNINRAMDVSNKAQVYLFKNNHDVGPQKQLIFRLRKLNRDIRNYTETEYSVDDFCIDDTLTEIERHTETISAFIDGVYSKVDSIGITTPESYNIIASGGKQLIEVGEELSKDCTSDLARKLNENAVASLLFSLSTLRAGVTDE